MSHEMYYAEGNPWPQRRYGDYLPYRRWPVIGSFLRKFQVRRNLRKHWSESVSAQEGYTWAEMTFRCWGSLQEFAEKNHVPAEQAQQAFRQLIEETYRRVQNELFVKGVWPWGENAIKP